MNKKIWFFEEVDLYNILCPYKYDKHIRQHPLKAYEKNDFIFMPNEIASQIYLVAEGKVKVGYYDAEGNEHIKAYLGKGELLGETSYLGSNFHKDFAQVVSTETRICKMSSEKARELARDYVPFAIEIHKKIAQNVQRLERKLEILFYKDARKRLEELLKDLSIAHYSDEKDNPWITHGLTQQEMASLIGCSRKTVSLLLNEFEREGLIELKNGQFRYVHQMTNSL
ncbi:MAG: Crp/Fnr family transcriptional regulator [Bacteroidia bacterium]|nr:Crp/Fnr family transcriptional regulator [Bacteroidia bacterium]